MKTEYRPVRASLSEPLFQIRPNRLFDPRKVRDPFLLQKVLKAEYFIYQKPRKHLLVTYQYHPPFPAQDRGPAHETALQVHYGKKRAAHVGDALDPRFCHRHAGNGGRRQDLQNFGQWCSQPQISNSEANARPGPLRFFLPWKWSSMPPAALLDIPQQG